MAAVVVVDQDAESLFLAAEVAISPTGGWRAATQKRDDTSQYAFYRSSDGGATWASLGTPDTTITAALVAIADNGDVHMAANKTGSSDAFYRKYSSGAWGSATNITGPQTSRFYPLAWFGYDGTNLVLLTGGTDSAIFDSTTGTSWTRQLAWTGSNFTGSALNGVFHNGYLHLVYNSVAGPQMLYRRYNPSTHVFGSPTTAPAFQTNTTAFRVPVVLARHNVTGELWAAQLPVSSSGLYLFKSIDTGDNWSTVVSAETIPTLTGRAAQGVSMGSDDKLHFWGTDGTGATVTELARTLAGTYDSAVSTVAAAGFNPLAHVAQRADGQQPNVAEIWMQFQQTSGTATPTRLTIITGVTGPGGWSVGTIKIGG